MSLDITPLIVLVLFKAGVGVGVGGRGKDLTKKNFASRCPSQTMEFMTQDPLVEVVCVGLNGRFSINMAGYCKTRHNAFRCLDYIRPIRGNLRTNDEKQNHQKIKYEMVRFKSLRNDRELHRDTVVV